jgi:hypothetical protein
LANDRDFLARLSINALERYRQQPTWEETAGQIREFLFSMIKNEFLPERQRSRSGSNR